MRRTKGECSSGRTQLAYVVGVRILLLVLILADQALLARYLGSEGRGSLEVTIIFSSLLSALFTIGCNVSGLYFLSSKKFSISETLTETFICGLAGSIVAIIVGVSMMGFSWTIFDKASSAEFYLSLASIPTTLFSITFLHLLTAIQEYKWFSILSIVGGLVKLLSTGFIVCNLSMGVVGALVGLHVSNLLQILFLLALFKWKYCCKLVRPSMARQRAMLHYGARYYLGKVSNVANLHLGTALLSFMGTREQVGVFAIAMRITTQVMIIPDTLTTVLIPKVAAQPEGKATLVSYVVRLTLLIMTVMLVLLVLFAQPIVELLFGRDYFGAIMIIRILAIGVLIRGAFKVFVPFLLAINRPGIASVSVAIGMLVNFIFLLILFPIYGLAGAAIGMSGGYIIGSLFLLYAFCKYSGLGMGEIWKYDRKDFTELLGIAKNRIASK